MAEPHWLDLQLTRNIFCFHKKLASSTVFPNCYTARLTRFNIPPTPPLKKYSKNNKHYVRCPNELIFSCNLKFIYCFFSVASPFLSDYSINKEKSKQLNIISFNIIVNEHHSKLGESL